MACSTSFYPCPMRASDIFKRQPTPPPMYYLKDHPRVEYNASDWPTTPEGEGDASTGGEVNDSNHTSTAGDASTVVRARPLLGLLSVRMREHREKGTVGSNGSANQEMPKKGLFASPTEQSAPAAKADISQGPPPGLKCSKATAETNVKPRPRKPLVAANANTNANANARNSKATSRPSRRRVQVVLTHAREEKENLPPVSDSDSEIDDPLAHAQKNPSKGQEQKKKQKKNQEYTIDTLPDPFVLTSSDECDDPLEGAQSETNGATAGEPDKIKGLTTTDSDPAPVTAAETADVGDAWTPKSCLRATSAPSKGHTVSFKDPLLRFHFYHYPDPNDIWSLCGLSMRPTLKLQQ